MDAPGGTAAGSPAEASQGQRSGVCPFSSPEFVRKVWALQGAGDRVLDEGSCSSLKNIGKPCAVKPHARFDEEGLAKAAKAWL